MATYEKISLKGIRNDIEEAFAKIRYSRIYETEEEDNERDDEELTEKETIRWLLCLCTLYATCGAFCFVCFISLWLLFW